MTPAVVVGVGPKCTAVRVHGETAVRTVPNHLVVLDKAYELSAAWPPDPREPAQTVRGRCTHPWTYRWMPHWSWIGWTVAQHQEHARGERPLVPEPEGLGLRRLVIVGCGGKKADHNTDAHSMYLGSYHRAARRAADKLVRASDGQLILSAKYGLLALHEVIEPYDLRMGDAGSVTVEQVRYQAEQLGLLDTEEVIVLAGRAYADVVSAVWPHALRPLDGTAGIGPQLKRLAAIRATGVLPAPKEPTVRMFPITEPLPADVSPARLDAGDVVDIPGQGELTLASQGYVHSSAKPTWFRFDVVGGKPFDVDTKKTVRLVAVGTAATSDAAVAAGSVIECPASGCGRRAKVRRDGKVGAHYAYGKQTCALVGEPVPAGVKVLSQPGQTPTKKAAAGEREIPLTEVTWGMYGRVKCMGPDGSRTESEGYVLRLPRHSTRGVGCPVKHEGEPLLSFDMSWPSKSGKGGGVTIGLKARPGTKFTVLDAPVDRPFTATPSDSRRMIVRDMRAGDLVGIRVPRDGRYFGIPGPDLLLTADPKKYGDDYYELTGLVAGEVETFVLSAKEMLDVKGPAVNHLIEKGPTATLTAETPGVRELPAPGETDPRARWKLLGDVSMGTSATAVARKQRMFAAMRRVHELPADATYEQIRAVRDADDRDWAAKCGDYWDAYALLLAEDESPRTAAAEPFPAGHGDQVDAAPAEEPAAPSAEQELDDFFTEMADLTGFFAELEADLGAVDVEQEPTPESAEAKLLAKVARQTPTDAVQRADDGSYRVLARWVASGVYVTATGVDEKSQPITASGYVVEARPLRGGYGGKHPDATVVVRLADTVTADPDHRNLRMVQLELDGRLVVNGAPAGKHPGVGYPYLRMPVEHQILAARTRLGLEVEVLDGPANELWRVEGCKEQIGSEVAWWLFGGRYGCWEARAEPVFRPSRIADAIQAGRYRDPESTVFGISELVQETTVPAGLTQREGEAEYEKLVRGGLLIDGAGEPLRAVDCWTCEIRKPHVMTSGITCPWEIVCPTCWAGVNKPCKRPSEHKVWGGLHDARKALAEKVDDARALAGDLRVPAPYPNTSAARTLAAAAKAAGDPGPVNAGPVLDELLAQADNPLYGRYGRQKAQEMADRYAAGLPLVRFKRRLDWQWVFNCPVPTCLLMFEGHNTVREARDHWFEHAAEHEGFVATWPDDVLPVEDEQVEEKPKRARNAKRKKVPPTAVIEVIEPVGNDWWDDSARAWERCGLLHRKTVEQVDGRETPVAVLSIPQGRDKAEQFAELLGSIGGVDSVNMHVRTLDETEARLDEWRRDAADRLAKAKALRTVRELDEVPPRPAGHVPTIVEVFAPPKDDPWWGQQIARWQAAPTVAYNGAEGITLRQAYPPSGMWPGGVSSMKIITPFDEEQARRWAADLAALGGLPSADEEAWGAVRIRVYRAAAAPEPGVDLVEEPAPRRARAKKSSATSPAYDAPALFDWDDFAASLEDELQMQ